MGWIERKEEILCFLRKYKYALLILLAGILLLMLPSGEKEAPAEAPVIGRTEDNLQESLEELLEKLSGAGRVSVLLTKSAGEETVYQVNENLTADETGTSTRRETVLVSGSGREESGLVRQKKAPTYLGAVVLCQGADQASVRLAVVEAVKSATGLTSDRICVLKMK